jgi:competence protein ComEC
MSVLYSFRQHALDVVYRIFPDPEASLLAGILLGEQSGIPSQVQDAFRLTGTSHVIVISGFNIAIIAGLFTYLFTRFLGRRWGAIVSALGIIFYTLMVGANPAVVRAAILGMLTLLALQVGRRQVGLNSLVFIAALMVLVTPTVLWDVSFQLSFAATLGIMLYAEPLINGFTNLSARFMSREKAELLAGPVGAYFLITLAAQVTTLPLMVYYFKRLSISHWSPIHSSFRPPPLMIWLAVSQGYSPANWPAFAWFAWLSQPPYALWSGCLPFHGSIPLVNDFPYIAFLCCTFIITFTLPTPSSLTRLTPAIPIALLATLTIMTWKAAFYAPDDLLHVTILDVGTGDAILIQSPEGRSVLINGGPSTIHLSDALGRRLPPFNRSLDWLVVAEVDNEDLSGISGNLERFNPANVLWAGNNYGTRAASDLWTKLITLSIPTTRMQPGQSLDLGRGRWMSSPDMARSLLKWDNFRLLLPMGMNFEALDALQHNSAMRNISALLLAESGYAPLNPPDLISFLHPQLALLSVVPADHTGLPSPETLDAVQGYNLLRTDQNGWIEVTTDGKQMWVEVERR